MWNILRMLERIRRKFYTANTVVSNQNHFRIYKHVSAGRNIVMKNFSCSENFQFWKSCNFYQELDRNLTKQNYKVKVNMRCHFALWVRFFPPYKCTHGPGEDPFEADMCAVGAASQIP